MKIKEIEKLKMNQYPITPLKYKKLNIECIGWDTETYKGIITLIANSRGWSILPKNINDILNFLCSATPYNINFFFNLEFDADSIIKSLPDDNKYEIAYRDNTIYMDGNKKYLITKIKGKALIIERHILDKHGEIQHKLKLKFFDIAQFYQIGSLEKTFNYTFICSKNKFKCSDNINRENRKCKKCMYNHFLPLNGGYLKSIDIGEGIPQKQIKQEHITYCIEDSIACQKLAQNFVNITHKILPVKDFYSPASLGRILLRMNMNMPYKFSKNSQLRKIQEYAFLSYNGGRFETTKIGKTECYQYDINSAYPYAFTQLADIEGRYENNTEYEENAIHSFFLCDIDIDKRFISPLRYETKNLLIYPTGKLKDVYISKFEYELLDVMGYRPKIKNAYHVFNDEPIYPYKFMEEMYKIRLKLKKELSPIQLPLKLAMNASYGLEIQTTPKITLELKDSDFYFENMELDYIYECNKCKTRYKDDNMNKVCKKCGNPHYDFYLIKKEYTAGKFFNPIIASEITGLIRCKLYKDSIAKEDSILQYATDSITTEEKLKLPVSDKLGEYSITEKMEGVIFGTGIQSFKNVENRETEISKFRGFSKTNMLEVAKKMPTLNEYHENKPHFFKLKECKKDFSRINIKENKEKIFRLNFDRKRLWDRETENFKDLLENQISSMPLEVN